ncbi:riboflavin synthase [Corynebacterium glyciniphilum]|uniref:riboflavin synthase n=1 Tax=Corynebacterium glyciniphilum TaxID=1404244 RepID=UPI00264D4FC4|nr:riboflavin synthase [Corynebacterium glyciniphilum]MDN5684294.1 riboflavin synthase [Corynebacterium glyciniphilum]MDN6704752.1 riboflavin synthase [Corynebacterium glyciniphilum]
MFTGIVEETGTVAEVDSTSDAQRIRISCRQVLQDATHGASISVNGVCLTVTEFDSTGFWADCMKVTLDYTALGSARPGDRVNLERATPTGGRLGGHIVQGHVDGTATLVSRTAGSEWEVFRFALADGDSTSLARYIAKKGSIAVNGVSLTVAEVGDVTDLWFEVSLIPTTLADTMLGDLATGDTVNIECDVLAKYLERLAEAAGPEGSEGDVR